MNNSSLESDAGQKPVIYSAPAVIQVITLLFLIAITNFNFIIYHLYMRKKPEFSNRLLNVIYSIHALLLQFGSFLTPLILIIPSTEVLVTIRMFHVTCVFISILCIGMANFIKNCKMDLYLRFSMKITRKIICMTTFLAAEGAALEATICLSGSKEISVPVMHFWVRPCPFC